MIHRVLAVSLLAGIVAGLLIATVQHFTTTPLILAAEVFESAPAGHGHAPVAALDKPIVAAGTGTAHQHAAGTPAHDDAVRAPAHAHDATVWAPADGLERTLATSTATVGAAVGFALLILAGLLLSGMAITERTAIGWGLGGFLATGLAPALGLAPELPGMMAADLLARQSWWAFTAVATAGAIFLFLRPDRAGPVPVWQQGLAVVLLLMPHLIGAPQLATPEATAVPAGLAAQFAASSLTVQALMWLIPALGVGLFWRLLDRALPVAD